MVVLEIGVSLCGWGAVGDFGCGGCYDRLVDGFGWLKGTSVD